MKHKGLILLMLVLMISMVSAVSVNAEDVIYIYKLSSKINPYYISALTDAGYNVYTVSYYDLNQVNFDNYDLMLVNDELFPNPDLIPVNDFPAVIANHRHMDDWGWTGSISSIASSQPLEGQKSRNDSITQGIPDVFDIYTECCYYDSFSIPVYYLEKSRFGKAPQVNTEITPFLSSNILDTAMGTVEQGDTLLGGHVANERGCFFGMIEGEYWTNWTEELFKRCAFYVVHGMDNDEDGYYEDVDCDDDNPDVYPGASEVCNGIDDDCDEEIDEEPAASASCVDSVGCTVDVCVAGSCQNNPDDGLCSEDTDCADYYCHALDDCQVNYEPDTTECRTDAGVCDSIEFCTGDSADCPADEVEPVTTECRASAGDCDVEEYCDGVSVDCPANEVEPITTECRASAGICDTEEYCDGTNAACPTDSFLPAATECRASVGICDVAEECTGLSADCPADEVEPVSFECRASAGVCDTEEYCDGTNVECPTDEVKLVSFECRASVGVCDTAENCDGTNVACPSDLKSSAECRASADICDTAEFCNGIDDACPSDEVEPVTTECRASAGDCDVEEYCDGISITCASDAKSTALCRATVGDCDAEEFCDGLSDDCPSDAFLPAATECRADAGDCDVAEECTGLSADCPVDGYEPDGTSCDDGLFCTVDDECASGVCGGASRDCADSISCTDDSCDEDLDTCEHPTNDANCDDGLFCNGEETCDELLDCQSGSPVVCSGNDLVEISECGNDPDSNPWTWDSAAGFTSECDEASNICTQGSYDFTHTCNIGLCGAECEDNGDCENYCSLDGTRYYNSPGCSECSCNYETENCNDYNGWYYTTNYQWVEDEECTEKEQREQEYRDYSCSPEECVFEVTDTAWEDTGETRNKPDETSCDDGLFCTTEDSCQSGICTGASPMDCSYLDDQCNTGVCNEDSDQCEQDSAPHEGDSCDNGLFCTVSDMCASGNCEGTARDCADSISCTDDSCSEDLDTCEHLPVDSYCDNGLFCDGAEYCDFDLGCQDSAPVDCSANNLPEIAECGNDPDDNPWTWDSAAGFTSACDEGADACTTSTYDYTHACSYDDCGAECDATHDCEDTDCDVLDGCYSGTYRNYNDVANTCVLSSCFCTDNVCSGYTEIITDLDGDGYDTECDGDCDDTDDSIYPGATEIMDDLDQNCVNDAPSFLDDVPNQEWDEDTIEVIDLSLYFDDADGDVLSFVSTSPDNIDVGIVGSVATLTPDANWHGTRYAVFTASDGSLSMSSNIVTLTVTPVNDAPTVETIPDQQWPEDTVRTLDLDDYFDDVDGDTLDYTSTTPSNIDADITGSIVTLTPDAHWHGTSNIQFTANDGNGGIVSSNLVNLVVTTVNDPPVLDYIPDISITEGDFIKILPGASDADGDAISFAFTWPLDSNGEWQTDFNDAGIYLVTISALDGNGGMDSQQVTITVNEAGNHAPVLDPIAPISVMEGDLVHIVPSASDLDYDILTFTFTGPLNSLGEWQTTYTDAGTYMPRVTVSDGLAIDWQDVLITVLESGNHAPVIDVETTIYVYEGELVVVSPNVYDPDDDAFSVGFSAPLNSNGMWQTQKGDAGTYYATISASDGSAVTNLAVKIVVSEPPFSDIYIGGIRIFNYNVRPGTNLGMSISFKDAGNIDMKGVKVAAYIPELGLYRRIGPFNLEQGEDITKTLMIYIPPDTPKGEYTMKIVISNDDVRREKHRIINIV